MKSLNNFITEALRVKTGSNVSSKFRATVVPGYVPQVFKDRRKTLYSDSELLTELFLTWAGWFNGKSGLNGSNPRAEKLWNELYRKYGRRPNFDIEMPNDKVLSMGPAIAKACKIGEFDFDIYQKSPKIQKIAQEVIELNMDWLLNGIPARDDEEPKLP